MNMNDEGPKQSPAGQGEKTNFQNSIQNVLEEDEMNQEIDQTLEAAIESRLRQKLDEALEKIIDQQLDSRLEQMLNRTLAEKIQIHIEDHLENTLGVRIQDHLEQKLEKILEKSLKEHVDRMVDTVIEKKLNQLQRKMDDASAVESKLESLTNKLENYLKIQEIHTMESEDISANHKRKKVFLPNTTTHSNSNANPISQVMEHITPVMSPAKFALGSPSFILQPQGTQQTLNLLQPSIIGAPHPPFVNLQPSTSPQNTVTSANTGHLATSIAPPQH